jgi:hypothetical protein
LTLPFKAGSVKEARKSSIQKPMKPIAPLTEHEAELFTALNNRPDFHAALNQHITSIAKLFTMAGLEHTAQVMVENDLAPTRDEVIKLATRRFPDHAVVRCMIEAVDYHLTNLRPTPKWIERGEPVIWTPDGENGLAPTSSTPHQN